MAGTGPEGEQTLEIYRSKCGLESIEGEDDRNGEDEAHGRAVSSSLRVRGDWEGESPGRSKLQCGRSSNPSVHTPPNDQTALANTLALTPTYFA
ncbi:hypothetical protein FRC00_012157, partial [Tulasnella sp. 408]